MYNNPFSDLFEGMHGVGSKLKLVAKVVFWLGVAGAVCAFIAALVSDQEPMVKFLVILFSLFGCLISYVGGCFIYAFSEIVDNTALNAQRVSKLDTTINNVAKETNKKLDEIDEKIAKINELINSDEEKRG